MASLKFKFIGPSYPKSFSTSAKRHHRKRNNKTATRPKKGFSRVTVDPDHIRELEEVMEVFLHSSKTSAVPELWLSAKWDSEKKKND